MKGLTSGPVLPTQIERFSVQHLSFIVHKKEAVHVAFGFHFSHNYACAKRCHLEEADPVLANGGLDHGNSSCSCPHFLISFWPCQSSDVWGWGNGNGSSRAVAWSTWRSSIRRAMDRMAASICRTMREFIRMIAIIHFVKYRLIQCLRYLTCFGAAASLSLWFIVVFHTKPFEQNFANSTTTDSI